MARSSLARAIFFGTKPQPSQIIHGFQRRPFPPVSDVPHWSSVSLPYSTKPTKESSHQPTKTAFSTRSARSSISEYSAPNIPSTSLLNPPPSARPPPWVVPEAPPKKTLSYYFSLGKASLSFYKNGIKAIYANYKLTRSIRARLSDDSRRLPRTEQLKRGLISRAEYHLLKRTRADLSRVPLFALIFLIFSEYTPLVVVAFSGAVPRTLWIPKQVQKAREKQQKRRETEKETWQERDPANLVNTAKLDQRVFLSVGRILNVYPAWWDRFLPWTPVGAVKERVQRRLEELEADDMAIERDGTVRELEDEEVSMAMEARGFDVLDKTAKQLRQGLQRWLQARKHHSTIELVVKGLPPSHSSAKSN